MMNQKKKTFFAQEVERISREYMLPQYLYVALRHSRAFMEKYHAEKIELESIAAAAFMSRFHYIRIFRQVYGITPRQYLRDLRINKAKELLQQGESVSQVCLQVGYQSLPTFSSAFKRGTGHSPKAYQQLHHRNPG